MEKSIAVMAVLLLIGGFSYRANFFASEESEAVLVNDSQVVNPNNFVKIAGVKTTPKAILAISDIKANQAVRESKEGILDSIDPEYLAEVYCEFVMHDNPELDQKTATAIAYSYAMEEFKYNLPKGLLVALGNRESSQKPHAVSSKEAHGVMQVQIPTGFDAAKRLGHISNRAKPKDLPKYEKQVLAMLKNPKTNIELGANTLHHYLRMNCGNLMAALDKYSCGANNYAGSIISRMQKIQTQLLS